MEELKWMVLDGKVLDDKEEDIFLDIFDYIESKKRRIRTLEFVRQFSGLYYWQFINKYRDLCRLLLDEHNKMYSYYV